MVKKAFKIALICFLITGIHIACDRVSESHRVNSVGGKEFLSENVTIAKMSIDGMVCAMGCAKNIENKVADLEGVFKSKVDFNNKRAVFEFDNTAMTAEEIKDYINSIHEGQYNADIVEIEQEQDGKESIDNQEDKQRDLGSVRQKIDFSFPGIFHFLFRANLVYSTF